MTKPWISDARQRRSKTYRAKHLALTLEVAAARADLERRNIVLPEDDKLTRKRSASVDFRLRGG